MRVKLLKLCVTVRMGLDLNKNVRDTSIKEDKIHLMSLTVTSWKTWHVYNISTIFFEKEVFTFLRRKQRLSRVRKYKIKKLGEY